jgi:ElaB/YqjD/DUF883 family membrane-anchored ribosome-binding protein
VYCHQDKFRSEDTMPHTREHDGTAHSNPIAETQTQQSGYTPASDMRTTRHTASEAADRLQQQADAGMERAAESAHKVAEKLHERAEHFDGLRADANEKVARTIDRTADYLREHDSEQLFGDVKAYVRKHPVQAVAGAIVGGVILGKFII